MPDLEKKLVEKFAEVLNAASAKNGRADSKIKRSNEVYARDAARFFLDSVTPTYNPYLQKECFYLNCPRLNLPKMNHSGVRIKNLFAAGGQHYLFGGMIDDFDSVYLAPFYVDLRKHQIRAERGGKIDRVRQEYTAEAKDELEYFIRNEDYTSIKNKIMPLLKSKFRNGKCAIRIPSYISSNEDDESEIVRMMKDNLRRASALDGLVHDNLLFSGGRYENPSGRAIQIVEYVPNLIDPSNICKIFNLREIAKLTKKALQSLVVLNDLGIAHRDIKPDNIFVSQGVRECNLKMSDFDMMRITHEGREHGPSSTQTFGLAFKGTPRYASPEHALDPLNLDVQSDICSLGLTVYKWWTGYNPIYVSESWKHEVVLGKFEMLVAEEAAKRNNPPVLPTSIESRAVFNGKRGFFRSRAEKEFEENFQTILTKMIAVDREDRYKTPEEAIADIDAVMEGLKVKPGINVYRVFSTSRRDISTSKNRPIVNN
ncbi:MAG: protein kinase [Candidatus Nanoarchaeia archaeon]|nr:protein kinase [Candidatus Nanoarchaeia archaeon]